MKFALQIALLVAVVTAQDNVPQSATNKNLQPEQTGGYTTVFVCDGDTLNISCAHGRRLRLIRANYGRLSVDVCVSAASVQHTADQHDRVRYQSVHCLWSRTLRHLQRRCVDESQCVLPVSSAHWHDMCPGTPKYLEVHYKCVAALRRASSVTEPMPPWMTSRSFKVARGNLISSGSTPAVMESSSDQATSRTTASPKVSAFPAGSQSSDVRDELSGTQDYDITNSPSTFPPRGENMAVKQKSSWSDSRSHPSSRRTCTMVQHSDPERTSSPVLYVDLKTKTAEDSNSEHLSARRSENRSSSVGGRCEALVSRGLVWNITHAGRWASQPCPVGAGGVARRLCHSATWHWLPADMSQCRSQLVTQLHRDLINGSSVESISQRLLAAFMHDPPARMYGGDIVLLLRLLNQLCVQLSQQLVHAAADHLAGRRQLALAAVRRLAQAAVIMVDRLLDLGGDAGAPWTDLSYNTHSLHSFTELLVALDNVAFTLADYGRPNRLFINGRLCNLFLYVDQVNVSAPQCTIFIAMGGANRPGSAHTHASVQLACGSLVSLAARNGRVDVVATWLPSVGRQLKLLNASSPPLVSGVLSVSLGVGSSAALMSPARIVLPSNAGPNGGRHCAVWHVVSAVWTTRGCRTLNANSTHTVCEFDRAGSYALVASVQSETTKHPAVSSTTPFTARDVVMSTVSTANAASKTVDAHDFTAAVAGVFYAGQLASAVVLLLALWRRTCQATCSATCHVCVCATAACVSGVAVSAVASLQQAAVCAGLAATLHYWLLATAGWLLRDALLLYGCLRRRVNLTSGEKLTSGKNVTYGENLSNGENLTYGENSTYGETLEDGMRHWWLTYALPLLPVASLHVAWPAVLAADSSSKGCQVASASYLLLVIMSPLFLLLTMALCSHALSWRLLAAAPARHVCRTAATRHARRLRLSAVTTVTALSALAALCMAVVSLTGAVWSHALLATSSLAFAAGLFWQHQMVGPVGSSQVVCDVVSSKTNSATIYAPSPVKMARSQSVRSERYKTASPQLVASSGRACPATTRDLMQAAGVSCANSDQATNDGYSECHSRSTTMPREQDIGDSHASPLAVYDRLSCRVHSDRRRHNDLSLAAAASRCPDGTTNAVMAGFLARSSHNVAGVPLCGTRIYSAAARGRRPRSRPAAASPLPALGSHRLLATHRSQYDTGRAYAAVM